MPDQPSMLDFAKAMSDADRLRILGMLTRAAAPLSEIASRLGMPARDAFDHLSFLEYVGLVRRNGEQYELNPEGLESLSRAQFAGTKRETYVPAPGLDEASRKVLVNHLNADGTIRQIPSQARKMRILLEYLAAAFTPGVDYTEKEVNTLLRRFHLDTATLRRGLVDAGLLARESDGSRYWRPA